MDSGQTRPSEYSGRVDPVLRCSIDEAADYLGMSKQDVQILMHTGSLSAEHDGNTWSVLLPINRVQKKYATQPIPLKPAVLTDAGANTPSAGSASPNTQEQLSTVSPDQQEKQLDTQPTAPQQDRGESFQLLYTSLVAEKDEQIAQLSRRLQAAEQERTTLRDRIRTLERQQNVSVRQAKQAAAASIDRRQWRIWMSQFFIAMLLGIAILTLSDYLINGDAIPLLPEAAAPQSSVPAPTRMAVETYRRGHTSIDS
jgi:hypothetical protein